MRKDNGQHSFIRLDCDNQTILGLDASYLFGCGVLDTFIYAWFCQNLYQIDESAPHFLFITRCHFGVGVV